MSGTNSGTLDIIQPLISLLAGNRDNKGSPLLAPHA
jgi:hypothetical protein